MSKAKGTTVALAIVGGVVLAAAGFAGGMSVASANQPAPPKQTPQPTTTVTVTASPAPVAPTAPVIAPQCKQAAEAFDTLLNDFHTLLIDPMAFELFNGRAVDPDWYTATMEPLALREVQLESSFLRECRELTP